MDRQTFERLLYEEENEALDFKSEQYRFVKSTEDEKSELLKDILGFVNAWRRSEAYILIGVQDVRGARANVVGIQPSDQLDDHSLQQFVNNLTNRPVRFRYEAFTFDDLNVGIVRVEQQPRPVFLKQNYGKLKKNAVYIRRGSSTDPSKPAGPDEIAQMGQASTLPSAELVVEFAELNCDDSLGTQVAWDTEKCDMPSAESIPDLQPTRQQAGFFGMDMAFIDPLNRTNRDYFRELASYEWARRLLCPTRLLVHNVGQVAAQSVRVDLQVSATDGAALIDESDMPNPPTRRSDFYSRTVFPHIRPLIRQPGDITVEGNDKRVRITVDCGDLQPGRKVWSEIFYAGRASSGAIELKGQVFADNLPKPKEISLHIAVSVRETSLSVDELLDLPIPGEDR